MIEELTPQVLMAAMTLIILAAPVVTLVISLLLIWRYRRAVAREMAASVGFRSGMPSIPAEPGLRQGGGATVQRRMLHGPRLNAMRYALAGGAFALVFAAAAHFVYPSGLGAPGFVVAVWIYFWPVVLALLLIVPAMGRAWTAWVLAYFAVLALLGVWASTVMNLPAFTFGAISLPERSSVTPSGMTRLWLTANAGPTLLAWLCFQRRVRAVAPLVLAIVTVALVGTLTAVLALFSPRGVDAAVAFSVSTGVHVGWLVAATYAGSLAGFGLLGWLLARAIAHAYRQRRASDQSLMVDALFAVFAATYGMWLVLGGAGVDRDRAGGPGRLRAGMGRDRVDLHGQGGRCPGARLPARVLARPAQRGPARRGGRILAPCRDGADDHRSGCGSHDGAAAPVPRLSERRSGQPLRA